MRKRNKWLKAMSIALSCAVLATTAPMNMLADEVTTKVDVAVEATDVVETVAVEKSDMEKVWGYIYNNPNFTVDDDWDVDIMSATTDIYVDKNNSIYNQNVDEKNESESTGGCYTVKGSIYAVGIFGINASRDASDTLKIDGYDWLAYKGYKYYTASDLESNPSLKETYEVFDVRGEDIEPGYELSTGYTNLKIEDLGSQIISAQETNDMPEYDMYMVRYYYVTNDGKEMVTSYPYILDGTETDLKFADDTESEKNYCGDNATYTLDENGLLTISGTGEIDDYAFEENEDIKKVVIEDGITYIGECAFSGCSNLASLDLPNSLTIIGSEAFAGCSNLTNVVIPDSVTDIWNGSFANCKNLVNVELPSGLDYWGNDVFNGCSGLTSIVIPNGIDRVNHRDFANCTNLKSVSIPVSVTDIRSEAFDGCANLTDIYYAGTESQWNEIKKGYESETCGIPDTATIHYESGLPNDDTETELPDDTNKPEEDNNTSDTSYEVTLPVDKTTISASDFASVLEANKNQDVVIKSNNNITFTFAKGTMANVDGMENYDFGTSVVSDFANAGNMGSTVTKDNFVTRINYNYSGKLPATATIKIYVGTAYAEGTTLYYSKIVEDGFKLIQSVKVDKDGYITITQDSCSDYVVTTNELTVTTPEDTQKPEEDTNKPEDTQKPEDDTNKPEDTQKPEEDTSTPEDTTTPEDDKTEEAPKTGDNSNIFVYVTMLVCGVGAVLMAMQKKLSR